MKNISKVENLLKRINIIGITVSKCMDMLEATKNIWSIPLFLIYKRMY